MNWNFILIKNLYFVSTIISSCLDSAAVARSPRFQQGQQLVSHQSHHSSASVRTKFSTVSKDDSTVPILNYRMAMPAHRIGNFLGFYFEALACADMVGMNFKANDDGQLIAHHDQFVRGPVRDDRLQAFVSALPHNRNPITITSANESTYAHRMKEYCQCEAFCYTYHTGAWQHRVALLGNVFTTAMATVLSQSHGIPVELIVNNGVLSLKSLKFDRTKNNVEMTARGLPGVNRLQVLDDYLCVYTHLHTTAAAIPLIPDVTVHVRCSDIMVVPDASYGFLPFDSYRLLIPATAKIIYILSDSPHRANEGAICKVILTALLDFLEPLFPKASIVLLRGGSQLTSMAQMMYSKVTICSTSTFCFWPALASNTTVYYPVTQMILNGTTPQFTEHFHWITDPRITQKKSDPEESLDKFINRLKLPITKTIVT